MPRTKINARRRGFIAIPERPVYDAAVTLAELASLHDEIVAAYEANPCWCGNLVLHSDRIQMLAKRLGFADLEQVAKDFKVRVVREQTDLLSRPGG